MDRVDAHVHAFPDRLALAVRGRLNERGGLDGGVLIGDVAAGIQAAGMHGAWILPYAHRAGVAEGINEWSAAEVTKFPWLVPGATFHPDDEDMTRLVERALVELGLRVVKLHCSVGQFLASDRRLAPLWEAAERAHVPVVVHAGYRSGGESAADEVEEVEPVLRAHPRLNLVLAHSGYPSTGAALKLMARFENLYGDLTPVWDRPVDISAAELSQFPGRFLFGSDFPNNPIGIEEQANRIREISMDERAMDMLMGGTAMRLQAGVNPDA